MTPSQYASMLGYAEAGFPGLDADLGEGSTDKLRAIIRILSENPGSVAHTKTLLTIVEQVVELGSTTMSSSASD